MRLAIIPTRKAAQQMRRVLIRTRKANRLRPCPAPIIRMLKAAQQPQAVRRLTRKVRHRARWVFAHMRKVFRLRPYPAPIIPTRKVKSRLLVRFLPMPRAQCPLQWGMPLMQRGLTRTLEGITRTLRVSVQLPLILDITLTRNRRDLSLRMY